VNAQAIVPLRRDVATKLRRITASSCLGEAQGAKTEAESEDGYSRGTTCSPLGLGFIIAVYDKFKKKYHIRQAKIIIYGNFMDMSFISH
jgi:hypothetical protein